MLLGLGTSFLIKGLGLSNDVFGNIVAVTGDAHQAQTAQDIFRADVRHELSLLIREDMRDVHALMTETTSTQITTGSIVLGVCFSVLVEGYIQNAAFQWVIEAWALLTAWAALLTFASLLLALNFLMAISCAAREKLLNRHRVFMPGDMAISSLGGHTVAERVGGFHASIVGKMVGLAQQLAAATRPEAETSQPDIEQQEAQVSSFPSQASVGQQDQQPLRVVAELSCDAPLCDAHTECVRSDSRQVFVRARSGMQAWLDQQTHELCPNKVWELPGFLDGSTLVRQPWSSSRLENLKLKIHNEATIYMAARLYPAGTSEAPVHADGLLAESTGIWMEEEMPTLLCGAHPGFPWFQRVEGFSVYVAEHKSSLPLYKVALEAPADDSPVEVEIKWNFPGRVESLVVILREGCVLMAEDEFPKRAFLQELEVMKPHLNFSTLYSQCGMSCLLLAVVCMHMARVSNVRPWPISSDEVIVVFAAAAVGLVGIWTTRSHLLGQAGGASFLAEAEAEDTGPGPPKTPRLEPRTPMIRTPGGRPSRLISTKSNGIVSYRLWKQRRWNWRKLACFSCMLGFLFFASVAWCTVAALGSASLSVAAREASTSSVWSDWALRWPSLFEAGMVAADEDGTLWAVSGWSVLGFQGMHGEVLHPPVRLPWAAQGLTLVGKHMLVVDEEGQLRTVQLQSQRPPSGTSALVRGLMAEAAVVGPPLPLPQEVGQGRATAWDGAPAGGLWADAAHGSHVLAVAYSSGHVVLYSANETWGRFEAMLQLEPFAQSLIANRSSAAIRALHISVLNSLPASSALRQAWLWVLDSDGRLTALGLSTATVLEVPLHWSHSGDCSTLGLTGNSTHLIALVSCNQGRLLRVAPFELLLPQAAGTLPPEL